MPAALLLVLALGSPDPRPVVEDAHRRYSRAIVADDQAAMDELIRDRYHPDFEFVKSDGRRQDYWTVFEASRYEAESRRAGRPDGPVRFDTTLRNWRRAGDRLTVDAHHRVVASGLDGGRRRHISYRNMIRETWVYDAAGWRALRYEEQWVRGEIDGKPFAFRRR